MPQQRWLVLVDGEYAGYVLARSASQAMYRWRRVAYQQTLDWAEKLITAVRS